MTQEIKSERSRGHAVVAGAGVAGLLAASVLAAFFRRVTIVERDAADPGRWPARRAAGPPRARAPAARPGRVERLLPGFTRTAIGRGAVAANAAADVSWGVGGVRLAAASDTLPVIVSTRPFLEDEIRRHVALLGNVTVIDRARVSDFVLVGASVTGVMLEREVPGTVDQLAA